MLYDNRGFAYEKKINDLLKKYRIAPRNFRPAASDSNAPDALIIKLAKEFKTEIKLDLKVDFGQGALDYDLKTGKWSIGMKVRTPAAEEMRQLLSMAKVPEIVNREWGKLGAPRKFTVPLDKFLREDSDYDQKLFTDKKIRLTTDPITAYYNRKDTYYIQVGAGYGFYYMGKDVAGFGCSQFKPVVEVRIRRKRGGSMPLHNYRFSTALTVVSLPKSNMNLDNKKDLEALAARAGVLGKIRR
jgi:hypothetical protein